MPVVLTKKGIKQAQQLAEVLANEPIETVYVSEFPRTQQTAAIINQKLQKPVVVDPLINENYTRFDGQPYSAWRKALKESPDSWNARFNNGESVAAAFSRSTLFLKKLQKSAHNCVLVITHGLHVEALLGLCRGHNGPDAMDEQIPQGEYRLLQL